MNLPQIKPITWKEHSPGRKEPDKMEADVFLNFNKPDSQNYDQPIVSEFQRHPLKPATGRLKEIEDTFIRITQQYRNKPGNREKIISLLDKYKRDYPNDEQLADLERLLKF